MATPVGHLLAGCFYGAEAVRALDREIKRPWLLLIVLIAASVIQDGDSLPNQIYGIDHWHREWTHALIVAPVAGVVGSILLRIGCALSLARGFFWVTLAWATHLLLDACAAGVGPKLLLPFSDMRVSSPLPLLPVAEPHLGGVFGDTRHPAEGGITYNLVVVLFEVGMFGSIILVRNLKGRGPKVAATLVLAFCLFGSVRQGLFRRALIPGTNPSGEHPEAMRWYGDNLRHLTPLDFALMREPRP